MAIQPVSDLILDVINQADPLEARATTKSLKAPAVVSKDLPVSENVWQTSSSFSRFMTEADNAHAAAQEKLSAGQQTVASMENRYSSKLETMDLGEKLEGAILQTFVKSMLPKELETVYGGGTAGSMWKGLMAEQLANQLAKTGSIGLSDLLMPNEIRPNLTKEEA